MRLHCMPIYDMAGIKSVKKISEIADKSNYYSVLFVYHSLSNDYWIRCANALNTNQKFKYFLAIRTYSISPEYFVMMYRSFNEIQKNRIMFNIVAGDIQSSESSIENIITEKEKLNTVEKRVDFTREWVEKVLFLLEKEEVPELVMSGTSEKTLDSAAAYADYNLSMLDTYLDNPKRFERNKNRMVCAAMIIRDTYDEAEKIANQIDHIHQKRWTIYGTENEILQKIKNLKTIGATDLLIRTHRNDLESHRIHEFSKKYKGVIL